MYSGDGEGENAMGTIIFTNYNMKSEVVEEVHDGSDGSDYNDYYDKNILKNWISPYAGRVEFSKNTFKVSEKLEQAWIDREGTYKLDFNILYMTYNDTKETSKFTVKFENGTDKLLLVSEENDYTIEYEVTE